MSLSDGTAWEGCAEIGGRKNPMWVQPIAPNVPLDEHVHHPGQFCVGCAELMGWRRGTEPVRSGLFHGERESFQKRVRLACLICFGEKISDDQVERNHRFLEESLELVQSLGCIREAAHMLVDYVYNRPIGDRHQEMGGVMLTLHALANAYPDMNVETCGEVELLRFMENIEKIRAKQAAKPKGSPLPVAQGCSLSPACVRGNNHPEACQSADGYYFYPEPADYLGGAAELLEQAKTFLEADKLFDDVGSDLWTWQHQVDMWLQETKGRR